MCLGLLLLGKHGFNPALAIRNRFDERGRLGAYFPYLFRYLVAVQKTAMSTVCTAKGDARRLPFQWHRLIMIRFKHKLAELIRPSLRARVKPSVKGCFIGQEDGLAVVEPGELGVGISGDNAEGPDGATYNTSLNERRMIYLQRKSVVPSMVAES